MDKAWRIRRICVTIRSEGITTAKTAKQVSTPQNGNTANLGTEAKHPELTAQKAKGADPECFMHPEPQHYVGMILYIAIAPVDAAGLPSLHKAFKGCRGRRNEQCPLFTLKRIRCRKVGR
jgi:hypothetical protein